MGQFIISENEKKQIRLLYEVNKPLPQASNFVKTLARYLTIEPSTIIGLDWSLYKNNNEIKTQLTNLFESSKKTVTNKINNVKLNTSLFNVLKQKLNSYVPKVPNDVTKEQKDYFDELKKGLTTDQPTTITTTVKQNQPTSNPISFDSLPQTTPTTPTTPTLSRFRSLI
jgi:vancomycin resistance protein YoaR